MRYHARRQLFGFELGCLGVLLLVATSPIWLLPFGVAQIVIQLTKLAKARAEHRAEQVETHDNLVRERDRVLAAARAGKQRAALELAYEIGISAYDRFKATGSLDAWAQWTKARDAIAAIRAWKFGRCPSCGAEEQLRHKPCHFCRQRVA